MAARIEHIGIVERVERDTVYVKITSQSSCGDCKSKEACGLAETKDKIVEIKAPDIGAEYSAGESVLVYARHRVGVFAILVGYVGALAVLLGALGIASMSGLSEGWSALTALCSVAGYYCLLWLFRGKIDNKIHFSVEKCL